MTENEPIKTVSDGITFLTTGRYYDGINRWVCHKIKEMDKDAINYAARNMENSFRFVMQYLCLCLDIQVCLPMLCNLHEP